MTIDKRMSYEMQGGMKNYLGKQKMVKAPKYWKSRPDKPQTELAYITKAEKDLIMKSDLHGSLNPNVKGKYAPNEGPSGIISLDYQGDKGTYGQAGQSYGDRERPGQSSTPSGKSSHHPGVGPTKTSTKTVSPKDHFTKSWTGPKGLFGGGGYQTLNVPGDTSQGHKSRFGMGNLFGGILGLLMGVPGLGLLTSGLSGLKDKFQGLRGYNEDGTPKTQEQWEEDRQTRINEKRIGNILNRTAPITEMTQKNLAKLGYTGNMPGVGSTPTSRAIDKDYARGTNTFDGPFSTSHLNTVKNKLPGTTQTFSDPFYGVGPVPNVPQLSMMEEYYNNNTPIGFVENLQNQFGEEVTTAAEMKQGDLVNLGAMEPGLAWGHNLTDQGKALEDFRNSAVNFYNSPNNSAKTAQSAYDFMMGTNPNMFKDVKQNKSFIQDAINQGFLADEADYTDQKPLDYYLARGGRVGYANGGLASLFTRRG